MNVYQCWYHEINGFCCRGYNSAWMFVPELGQLNNRIRKHVALDELIFDNYFAKQFELTIEQQLERVKSNPYYFLKELFFPTRKAATVGGMLFMPI